MECFGNFIVEFFGGIFFGGIFWEIFYGRIFWGGIFWGGFFWVGFLGRNYLVEINKQFMFLSRFLVILSQCKEEEGRRMLILRSATQAHHT